MLKNGRTIKIYTVVEAWRGLIDNAKCFPSRQKAMRYLRARRRRANTREVDLELFEN